MLVTFFCRQHHFDIIYAFKVHPEIPISRSSNTILQSIPIAREITIHNWTMKIIGQGSTYKSLTIIVICINSCAFFQLVETQSDFLMHQTMREDIDEVALLTQES